MDKTYRPGDIEQRVYQRWEENGWFAPSGSGEPYCIVIPPPNVTGTLHMGHAFQDTIMDALTRYHRMLGRNTLWQPGMDHAGIATQMVVERQLQQEGTSRVEIGREAFVERVWKWKDESGGQICNQLRRLGGSVDWSRDRFTMDEGLSAAVLEVFVQLYDEGLIYRGNRLVNWDPVLHTALSDLEVLDHQEAGHLWHFRYPLASGDGHLVVATTRPETMLGDSAVAVHPDDARYKKLIGEEIILPLVERSMPIIADDYVDPEFGSGCVKITPAHDFNDYEIGKRHGLPEYNIFDADAAINDTAPEAYRGMDRFDARARIVTDMEKLGLLDKVEDYTLTLPRGDRSGAIIEPYLTDQWYIDIEPLAKPAIEAVESGRIRFIPDNWSKTYFEWMHNIKDWCISRQLWWGHRIPAWYDNDGKVYVARNEQEVRKKHNLDASVELRQDDDVLDTWFSSGLWPFTTQGWPQQTDALNTFYPGQVLVTGFDIIFFWVARMIMFGLKFMDEVPFHEVYIHGLIRDQDGQKMSKSKGNVLDPLDLIDGVDLETLLEKRTTGLMQTHLKPLIEKATRKQFPNGIDAYGADALRFTFASIATTGRDLRFDIGRIEGYKNFCNKLWNAARYVLMNTESLDDGELDFSAADEWVRSRLQATTDAVHQGFSNYRLDLVSQALYEFTWHEFCDWYLELSKPVLQSQHASDAQKRATRKTLIEVLEELLRLLHPLMPFVTEEIWQEVAPVAGKQGETIMTQPFPAGGSHPSGAEVEAEIEWLRDVIVGIRNIRGEMDISPGKALPVWFENASQADLDYATRNRHLLERVGKIESVRPLSASDAGMATATAMRGEMILHVPMAGIIDIDAEKARLTKLRERTTADIGRVSSKLDNPNFLNNAPADVVTKTRQQKSDLELKISQLDEQLARLGGH
ncbi:MAG: valine--tRNA ligase [Woeseiaceae bacterium]|nr:valine--tRNA ligase [Woeseiaceae bacterium]